MNVGFEHEASTNGSSAAGQSAIAVPPADSQGGTSLVRSRPEVLVGAAFAGGVVAAFLLRRLGR